MSKIKSQAIQKWGHPRSILRCTGASKFQIYNEVGGYVVPVTINIRGDTKEGDSSKRLCIDYYQLTIREAK